MDSSIRQRLEQFSARKMYARRSILHGGVLLGSALLSSGCTLDLAARANNVSMKEPS